MNPINLPLHLVRPAVLSLLILVMIFITRKRIFKNVKWKWFWISITIFFSCYLFILLGSIYAGVAAQWHLNSFDLNQDGFFQGNEISPEQQEAMHNVMSDTAQNFAHITGLMFAGTIGLISFVVGSLIEYVKSKRQPQNLK